MTIPNFETKDYFSHMRKILLITLMLTFLLIIRCDDSFFESDNIIAVDAIAIDSIYKITLYRLDKRVVAAEYSTFGQIIKAGIIDTNFISKYIFYSPHAGSDLFIYNCASCHYAPPSFSESIKIKVPTDKDQLKNVICSPPHSEIDSSSCRSLNDFEVFLLARYLNLGRK